MSNMDLDEQKLQRIKDILLEDGGTRDKLNEKEIAKIFKYVAESTNAISNVTIDLENGKSLLVNKKAVTKMIKETDLLDAILETSFDEFLLTSQETELTKYSKELEIDHVKNIVKTKDRFIKQCISYTTTVKGKKIVKKENGRIVASFQSPLDWLNKKYEFNVKDSYLTDREIIEKVEATKTFDIRAEHELIYNAICALLRKKPLELNTDKDIFISFNELHSQLGYKDKLRLEARERYKGALFSLAVLFTNINLEKAVYAGHKEYKKVNGNIENEPLVIYKGFKRAKAKINKTTKIVDGFTTDLTELMKLHFNYTKHYKTTEIQAPKRKSKLKHSEKLECYIKKLYFINIGNKNYCIDLNYKTIFDELKEFDLEEAYNNTNWKTRFIQRKFLSVIAQIDEVKETKIIDSKIRIYFQKNNKKP
jgi:hypothetical protein